MKEQLRFKDNTIQIKHKGRWITVCEYVVREIDTTAIDGKFYPTIEVIAGKEDES